MPYDRDNVFARILRGEIPCNKVYEDEHVLAFHDINPLTPTHILVIPKGRIRLARRFFRECVGGRALGDVPRARADRQAAGCR